jgi:hypothetical protein
VRVLIAVFASAFHGEHMQVSRVGGERESQLLSSLAFLVPPQRAANAYLEPNRNSLQKTIGGLSPLTLEHAKPMLKTI